MTRDGEDAGVPPTSWREPMPYWDEDPFCRQEWEALLHQEGGESRMDDAFYHRPPSATASAPGRTGA